jgi:hypothetical protein
VNIEENEEGLLLHVESWVDPFIGRITRSARSRICCAIATGSASVSTSRAASSHLALRGADLGLDDLNRQVLAAQQADAYERRQHVAKPPEQKPDLDRCGADLRALQLPRRKATQVSMAALNRERAISTKLHLDFQLVAQDGFATYRAQVAGAVAAPRAVRWSRRQSSGADRFSGLVAKDGLVGHAQELIASDDRPPHKTAEFPEAHERVAVKRG